MAEAQMVTLTRRQQVLLRRYSDAAGNAVAQAWDRLDSWDDAVRLAELANPSVSVLSARASAATQGYMGLLTGEPVALVTPTIVTPDWDSALIALRKSLKEGHDFEQALLSGRIRSEAVGTNAVIRSARLTSDTVASQRITGWMRVVSSNSCRWCQTVSTQRYHSAESADFGHDRCHCGVAPIFGEVDPGRVVNQDLLDQLNAER